ncbi:MAG: hypothetical protein GY789_02360 [Hyphomicrobiales bacterium]|nr:hypothetical protein [Hyphomicrobiales bacterium]MCP5000060.1 hypothetical protein [Hyphomicrobiales bacterium]
MRQPIIMITIPCVLLALLTFFSGEWWLTIIFGGLAGYTYIRANNNIKKDKTEFEDGSISLTCPLCHDNINLADPWSCGSCGHIHNENLANRRPTIPLQHCQNHMCNHKDQNGFQCPHCRSHLVLDCLTSTLMGQTELIA